MLPIETILAVFPPSVKVCRFGLFRTVRLRPITLLHATAMEAFGCGIGDEEITGAKALIAGWLLTLSTDEVRKCFSNRDGCARRITSWSKHLIGNVARLSKAVNGMIVSSMSTFVRTKSEDQGNVVVDSGPKGFGWTLEIAEEIASAYGMKFDDALDMPVHTALALVSINRRSNGAQPGGPDYYERLEIARLKRENLL